MLIDNLFYYMTRTKYLGTSQRNDKYLLVFTNFIFLYVFYLLYKQNNVTKRTYILIIVFLISSIYHFNQCHNHSRGLIDTCNIIDFITCSIIGIYLLLFNYHKINLKIILLFLLSLYFLDRYSNITEYIYCHSIWHILMGITVYYILK
jgi:hypothetical protein